MSEPLMKDAVGRCGQGLRQVDCVAVMHSEALDCPAVALHVRHGNVFDTRKRNARHSSGNAGGTRGDGRPATPMILALAVGSITLTVFCRLSPSRLRHRSADIRTQAPVLGAQRREGNVEMG